MAFFPDVKSLDKLLNNDWKTLVYGEQSETWNDKLYSFARQAWSQILTFLESRGRQLQNYWPLYAAFFVGSFIILATYKSLRYVGMIKSRKPVKYERRVNKKIRTEESRINSNDGNDESLVEKPCPTSRSDLDNAAAIPPDNDCEIHDHSRHDSSVSSDTTIVAVEGKKSGEFLINFINSIEPGDDAVVATKHPREDAEKNEETLDLPESTRQKVDSNNCKHFYVLTPWIGPPEDQESCTPAENLLPPSTVSADDAKAESTSTQKVNKNNWGLVESDSPQAATVNTVLTDDGKSTRPTTSERANSTLAVHHESSSICCADEVLSRISDTEENIFLSPNTEKQCESSTTPKIERQCNNRERVFNNIAQKLPELDLSPISREPLQTENATNIMELEIRTDSKHRFRSLSHDSRTVSSAEYINTRRGSSVSPPARNKNNQRAVRQMQSKIPTLSPLAHRTLHQHLDSDGTVAETANQIRSVLLRKLKEVWEQHPRDRTPSPNCSMYSSLDSSVYYTPENVSRIPLPRRSPRHSDANDVTRSPRVESQSDRSANQSEQSKPGNSRIANERTFPDDVSGVPLHSTPKPSPLSRGSNHRR